ncbi:MAG: DUF2785 domain-containing protein [Acidimicrobiales bacterium]
MSEHSTPELAGMLRSPDPHTRDDIAYSQLADRIAAGGEDEALVALGDEMAMRLEDPEIHSRSFASLVLAEIVDRDRVTGRATAEALMGWRDRFARCYRTERDLRGWDERLGWLHAVAHGADTIGAFGRSPRLEPDDLAGLLHLARDRLLEPTDTLFGDQEDDRLGYGIALVLSRRELDSRHATEWLEPIGGAFDLAEPGPVPPWASNTMRTLRVVYLLADRGFRLPEEPVGGVLTTVTHGKEVCEALADVLRSAWPYLG